LFHLDVARMRVGINDARNHNAAAEVGGFCAVGYEGFGTGVVAQVDEFAVLDDQRVCQGLGLIHRIDLSVRQHPIKRVWSGA